MATNEEATNAYNSGYEAGKCGILRSLCPYGYEELNLRCMWLGGWNDYDMDPTV